MGDADRLAICVEPTPDDSRGHVGIRTTSIPTPIVVTPVIASITAVVPIVATAPVIVSATPIIPKLVC